MASREMRYGAKDYEPSGAVDKLWPGTFYLAHVDSLYRRQYALK
jgi:hydroxymethylglutaryl-CoA synthase